MFQNVRRWLAWAGLLGSGLVLAVSMFVDSRDDGQSPSCVIADDISLWTVSGKTYYFGIRVRNVGSESVRVLGIQSGTCSIHGCYGIDGVPISVPPGETVSFDGVFYPREPGRYTTTVPLITDEPNDATVPLNLTVHIKEAASTVTSTDQQQ